MVLHDVFGLISMPLFERMRAMGADMKSRFRAGAKVCSGAVIILLVILALGPENWTPRTPFGWQFDHFIGYFVITLVVCFAWPRPFVVAGILVAASFLLEGLQAFTPDRTANLEAAFCGAGGVLAAALVAELSSRAWRSRLKSAPSAN
jgi:VanZ family protein